MERILLRVGAHTDTAFSEGAGDDATLVVHGGPGVPAPLCAGHPSALLGRGLPRRRRFLAKNR